MNSEKPKPAPNNEPIRFPNENQLSPEMLDILHLEMREAEIQMTLDAAAEEGIILTREEVLKILQFPLQED